MCLCVCKRVCSVACRCFDAQQYDRMLVWMEKTNRHSNRDQVAEFPRAGLAGDQTCEGQQCHAARRTRRCAELVFAMIGCAMSVVKQSSIPDDVCPLSKSCVTLVRAGGCEHSSVDFVNTAAHVVPPVCSASPSILVLALTGDFLTRVGPVRVTPPHYDVNSIRSHLKGKRGSRVSLSFRCISGQV